MYVDATVLGSRFTTRILVERDPVPCPGCEGHGWVAWFTWRLWPTPHELPIDRARLIGHLDNAGCGKARPCRYCQGTGLWGGDVQREIADRLAQLVDESIQEALLQGFSDRRALREGSPKA